MGVEIKSLVVVVDRNREHLFGVLLANHEIIESLLNFAGLN